MIKNECPSTNLIETIGEFSGFFYLKRTERIDWQNDLISQKSKRDFNKFLFDIVNQFSLDEFKQYTNFSEVIRRVLMEKTNSAEPSQLDHYTKLNFKKNIPNEKTWSKGGFVSLKLTNGFYESETAARIFRKIYGIMECEVVLSETKPLSDRVDRVEPIESDFEIFQEVGNTFIRFQ